ncbi:MAG: ATP-binding cassette domain-containing protein [Oscillospiraceae bacterium]|nr:ATP-binding cassette domain-containing protein [Oscillospiraceae bacterium]
MLQLKNISFSVSDGIAGEKEILQDINLTIDDSKLVVITGPNGGGKSTLVKIIAGIEKPTSGRIILDGQDITDLDITERAKLGISFAFQQPVRFKGLRVCDLLALAAGVDAENKEEHDALCSYLHQVGLCAREYIDRELDSSLSGGEIKRIEIAMTMARNARLAIFDEPEAGIDLWSFNNLIDVFENMRQERERSILVISHQERILEVADEIIVLSKGQLVHHGAREDVLPELLGQQGCGFCPHHRKGCE